MTWPLKTIRTLLIAATTYGVANRLPSTIGMFQQQVPPWHWAQPALREAHANPRALLRLTYVGGGTCALVSLASGMRLPRLRSRYQDELETPLINLNGVDQWSVRNALEGTLVLGATGSGKTSGAGRTLALAMLRAGWGGLVLSAKQSERQVWEGYCAEAGRSQDLILFGANGAHAFNPLTHELAHGATHGGLTANVVNLLSEILEVAEPQASDGKGGGDNEYWRKASKQLVRNAVDLIALAGAELTIYNLYLVVISAPPSMAELHSAAWREKSYCFELLRQAEQAPKSPSAERDLELVADYFCAEFPQLSDKTRSVIVSTFTSSTDLFNRGLLRDLLCSGTTITPQVIEQGKILFIDLPSKEFSIVGTTAQVVWKFSFMRSIERRRVTTGTLPCFWFADEFQNFLSPYDFQFLATCRSARVASVLLTQNLGGLEASLGGGAKGEAAARALVGNLNTKIFCANGDPHTNEWAANLIGKSRQLLSNSGQSRSNEQSLMTLTGLHRPGQYSSGVSETIDYRVQPAEFSRLKTGGPANRGICEALLFQNGRKFASTGLPYTPVQFKQF